VKTTFVKAEKLLYYVKGTRGIVSYTGLANRCSVFYVSKSINCDTAVGKLRATTDATNSYQHDFGSSITMV
jgi:hypothetical protein